MIVEYIADSYYTDRPMMESIAETSKYLTKDDRPEVIFDVTEEEFNALATYFSIINYKNSTTTHHKVLSMVVVKEAVSFNSFLNEAKQLVEKKKREEAEYQEKNKMRAEKAEKTKQRKIAEKEKKVLKALKAKYEANKQ